MIEDLLTEARSQAASAVAVVAELSAESDTRRTVESLAAAVDALADAIESLT